MIGTIMRPITKPAESALAPATPGMKLCSAGVTMVSAK